MSAEIMSAEAVSHTLAWRVRETPFYDNLLAALRAEPGRTWPELADMIERDVAELDEIDYRFMVATGQIRVEPDL